MKVAVCGYGWVGKAMHTLFPEAVIYDKYQPMYISWVSAITQKPEQRAINMADVNSADVAFICVPTPNKEDGALDTSIVEEVVKECTCPLIIIRSTLQPGTCDYLEQKYQKNIVMMPEYLGETVAHPLLDETKRQFLIIGGKPENRRKAIELFQTVYNANVAIRQVTNLEAEVIKLSENRAIMFKVLQAQELFDVCEKAGVDYYTIQQAVYGDDPRFTLWFTHVYPDKRGANSKCIPKDPVGWCAWAKSVGYTPKITQALLEKNKDWIAQNDQKLMPTRKAAK